MMCAGGGPCAKADGMEGCLMHHLGGRGGGGDIINLIVAHK